jgi:proteic killer suppression protein
MSDFRNAGTEDIYNGDDTKASRRILPTRLHDVARRKMTIIRRAFVRINRQYRVCFTWDDDAAANFEIIDYR